MRTEFDAQNVTYAPMLLYTSIPLNARLEFTMDGTSYVALIRLVVYLAP